MIITIPSASKYIDFNFCISLPMVLVFAIFKNDENIINNYVVKLTLIKLPIAFEYDLHTKTFLSLNPTNNAPNNFPFKT